MSEQSYAVICHNILHKEAIVELSDEEHVVSFEKDKERGVAVATGVPGPVASALTEREGYEVSDELTVPEPDDPTPTSVLDGIGEKTEAALADAGAVSVRALAEADPETLAEETDLGEDELSGWIGAAKARLDARDG